jgi:SAM-dependent methyltransferase
MEDSPHPPEYWIERWKASIAKSMPGRGGYGGYASPRIWDRMASGYDREDDRSGRRRAEMEKTMENLSERGFLRKGARVLDVGCGTGRAAIAFALRGACVTALDFSNGMLERLRASVPPGAADLVEPVQGDWEDMDLAARGWESSFDLACAFMTPAIATPDSFLKLHRASRLGCVFRGWAGRREDPLLAALWRDLRGEPLPARGWDITLAFNLLKAMGLDPDIEFREVAWESRQSVADAAAFFVDFFSGLTDDTEEELRTRITDCLQRHAGDGQVTRRTEGRIGTMIWKVTHE